ncbi:hypothetical protein AGABI1DRAFT_45687 [Agaricus bisporus var. burnettii JB137-S8]|uniref:Cytochrome P450 n=1 Tax=Agaricus bisporus var. burnettii (strain JB137-S8 / ATCC MYA-4627 / FGSC 10392) TaxID=597362 RepID=K5WKU4_AGABU|nr:uncharacterized protein AGABI1DRAFT_45687 [Agaricus bisporus var. burnettii JB137-S8]EKM75926.1 hypothetical protein AGABI1DRAFT_45687 [Agaricus bisporus var. burnettii JB137-S8]
MPLDQGALRPLVSVLNISGQLLAPLSLSIGVYALFKLTKFVWWEYISNPLKDVPGPVSPSLLSGHIQELVADFSAVLEEWASRYGNIIKYKSFLATSEVVIMDAKAINHIMNDPSYQKPTMTKMFISGILGPGIVIVEGYEHQKQRKVMNPAFGAAQIRELTEIFVEKALELRDVWAQEIQNQTQGNVHQAKINALEGLSKTTLDVIGLAAFNYKFDSLKGEKNELNTAFSALFTTEFSFSFAAFCRMALGKYYWILPLSGDKAVRRAKETMDRISIQLVNESRAAIASEGQDKNFNRRRDLLSLLVKANVSADLPEHQRMNEKDVLAQIPTFIIAGHETTSTAATWALFALSTHPDIQTKLREELFTIQTDNPSMDELNSLPYLDAVLRETLRLHTPSPSVLRVSTKDDILPLAKPFVDEKGRLRDMLELKKGQIVLIPIKAINKSVETWGEDAKEFKPERWESIPEGTSTIQGVWGNMLTFLGGPRACIGFRFALVEFVAKALLFTLVRTFDFQLAVPVDDIGRRMYVAERPMLRSDPKAGGQMPLLITPYIRED